MSVTQLRHFLSQPRQTQEHLSSVIFPQLQGLSKQFGSGAQVVWVDRVQVSVQQGRERICAKPWWLRWDVYLWCEHERQVEGSCPLPHHLAPGEGWSYATCGSSTDNMPHGGRPWRRWPLPWCLRCFLFQANHHSEETTTSSHWVPGRCRLHISHYHLRVSGSYGEYMCEEIRTLHEQSYCAPEDPQTFQVFRDLIPLTCTTEIMDTFGLFAMTTIYWKVLTKILE